MASNVTLVRVTLRETGRADADFRGMLSAFRKACSTYGIAALHKRYEFYEKPSEKRAKKKREQGLEREKAKRQNEKGFSPDNSKKKKRGR